MYTYIYIYIYIYIHIPIYNIRPACQLLCKWLKSREARLELFIPVGICDSGIVVAAC